MAQIKLFGSLQRRAGTTAVITSGETVAEVLQVLITQYPELETAVFDPHYQLNPHVRVMVNGHDIELADGLQTAVTNQDAIAIFPPIAGG